MPWELLARVTSNDLFDHIGNLFGSVLALTMYLTAPLAKGRFLASCSLARFVSRMTGVDLVSGSLLSFWHLVPFIWGHHDIEQYNSWFI